MLEDKDQTSGQPGVQPQSLPLRPPLQIRKALLAVMSTLTPTRAPQSPAEIYTSQPTSWLFTASPQHPPPPISGLQAFDSAYALNIEHPSHHHCCPTKPGSSWDCKDLHRPCPACFLSSTSPSLASITKSASSEIHPPKPGYYLSCLQFPICVSVSTKISFPCPSANVNNYINSNCILG